MQHLSLFSTVNFFAIKHSLDCLGYLLFSSCFQEEIKACFIDFGVRKIHVDFVQDFESESSISFVVLKQLAEGSLGEHLIVVLFESHNGRALVKCLPTLNHFV